VTGSKPVFSPRVSAYSRGMKPVLILSALILGLIGSAARADCIVLLHGLARSDASFW